MTVGELRERILHLPQDMDVAIECEDWTDDIDLAVDTYQNLLTLQEVFPDGRQ